MAGPACPFCTPPESEIIFDNDYAYVRYDKAPVSRGHLLVIPKRHVAGYFDTTTEERTAILQLIDECKRYAEERYSPDGYNIGVNVGTVAGQSVMHVHFHFIPRYAGDTERPAGGVRRVIPEKGAY